MLSKEMDVLNKRTVGKPDLLLSYLEYALNALQAHGLQLQVCVFVLPACTSVRVTAQSVSTSLAETRRNDFSELMQKI